MLVEWTACWKFICPGQICLVLEATVFTNQEDVFELEDYFLHCPRHQRTAHRPCDQVTGMRTKAEEIMHAAIVMTRQDTRSRNSAQA
jgi:hypothetical protein